MNMSKKLIFATLLASLLAIPAAFAATAAYSGGAGWDTMWVGILIGGIVIILLWGYIHRKFKGRDVPEWAQMCGKMSVVGAGALIIAGGAGSFIDLGGIYKFLVWATIIPAAFLIVWWKQEKKAQAVQGGTTEGVLADTMQRAREEGGIKGMREAAKAKEIMGEEQAGEKLEELAQKEAAEGKAEKVAAEEGAKLLEAATASKEILNTLDNVTKSAAMAGSAAPAIKRVSRRLWKAIYHLHDQDIDEIKTVLKLEDAEVAALTKIEKEEKDQSQKEKLEDDIGRKGETIKLLRAEIEELEREKKSYKGLRRREKGEKKGEKNIEKKIKEYNKAKLDIIKNAIKEINGIKITPETTETARKELKAKDTEQREKIEKGLEKIKMEVYTAWEKAGMPVEDLPKELIPKKYEGEEEWDKPVAEKKATKEGAAVAEA